jgi:N-acetylglucosaminyldiphosphoundecaprenol N-acetyl-beta-D-mannosaminyltransferase
MLEICRRAEAEQLPIFLYGGTDAMLEALRLRLTKEFPQLQFAGLRRSAFRKLTPDERDQAAADIRASGAKITFIGLGCPRQEVFAYEMRERLGMPLLAVGAAFNFHAGILPQAPANMQRFGLEWLYRLVQEPRRLWKRYLLLNPLYLAMLSCQWTGLWKSENHLGHPPTEELRYG